jgi:hypothetical protein
MHKYLSNGFRPVMAESTALPSAIDQFASADAFTRAYIQTALWCSTGPAFGECPCCGGARLLNRWPEEQFTRQEMCDGPECGTRETHYEPPLEDNYGPEDFTPEAMAQMLADCAAFQAQCGETIAAAIATGEVKCGPDFDEIGRAGHDFWLTRCGHGCGFWDGDWPEPMAEALTKAAEAFGNVDITPGDDGKLYL